MAQFRNPSNGYTEEVKSAGLWCFLFGFLYFAVKGVWTHAVVSLLLALVTFGISWLIYPFFAQGVIETSYLRRGWVQIKSDDFQPSYAPNSGLTPPAAKKTNPLVIIVCAIFGLAVIMAVANEHPSPNGSVGDAQSTVAKATPSISSTRNPANDRLSALPPLQQAINLAQVVGEGCVGIDAFLMGSAKSGAAPGAAFWSLRCETGKTYAIQINADARGSTRVMDCAALKAIGAGECFKKFEK